MLFVKTGVYKNFENWFPLMVGNTDNFEHCLRPFLYKLGSCNKHNQCSVIETQIYGKTL